MESPRIKTSVFPKDCGVSTRVHQPLVRSRRMKLIWESLRPTPAPAVSTEAICSSWQKSWPSPDASIAALRNICRSVHVVKKRTFSFRHYPHPEQILAKKNFSQTLQGPIVAGEGLVSEGRSLLR